MLDRLPELQQASGIVDPNGGRDTGLVEVPRPLTSPREVPPERRGSSRRLGRVGKALGALAGSSSDRRNVRNYSAPPDHQLQEIIALDARIREGVAEIEDYSCVVRLACQGG